jgi:DNA (cytosine-5)-methyltransferase 1
MKSTTNYKFIDLFAGIGGFHLALHELGMECVFASEIEANCRKTYEANFKNISPNLFENDHALYNKDITQIDPNDIPDFDILCGGFPCQPFSNAGQKKGFEDTRGTLFFNVAEIIKVKKPKAFFLENVRGLFKHDEGKTFETIKSVIEEDLGYSLFYKIVHASDYGMPQARPRLYMIGLKNVDLDFEFPANLPLEYTMSDVWGGNCSREIGFTLRCGGRGSPITDRRNWDSYMVNGQVKRLTKKEGLMMQGFPNDFVMPVTETQAMKQLGNSVAVPAIRAVARQLQSVLNSENIQSSFRIHRKNKLPNYKQIPVFELEN